MCLIVNNFSSLTVDKSTLKRVAEDILIFVFIIFFFFFACLKEMNVHLIVFSYSLNRLFFFFSNSRYIRSTKGDKHYMHHQPYKNQRYCVRQVVVEFRISVSRSGAPSGCCRMSSAMAPLAPSDK